MSNRIVPLMADDYQMSQLLRLPAYEYQPAIAKLSTRQLAELLLCVPDDFENHRFGQVRELIEEEALERFIKLIEETPLEDK